MLKAGWPWSEGLEVAAAGGPRPSARVMVSGNTYSARKWKEENSWPSPTNHVGNNRLGKLHEDWGHNQYTGFRIKVSFLLE